MYKAVLFLTWHGLIKSYIKGLIFIPKKRGHPAYSIVPASTLQLGTHWTLTLIVDWSLGNHLKTSDLGPILGLMTILGLTTLH